MIYFIADPHLGHENILKLCSRPFPDIETMNETIIAAWNDRVTGNDTVYILGDLFYRCADPEPILRRLKGKKHLVEGNPDISWMENERLLGYFVSVDEMLVVTDGEQQLILCHYPLLTWKRQKHSYMIHGHIHDNTGDDFFPLIVARERLLNAGVEINGYRPVTFDELVENNAGFKEKWLREKSRKK